MPRRHLIIPKFRSGSPTDEYAIVVTEEEFVCEPGSSSVATVLAAQLARNGKTVVTTGEMFREHDHVEGVLRFHSGDNGLIESILQSTFDRRHLQEFGDYAVYSEQARMGPLREFLSDAR